MSLRVFGALTGGLLLCLAVDWLGWDMPMAKWFGNDNGFSLRDAPLLDFWLYDTAKLLALLGIAALFALVRWPVGLWRSLRTAQRLSLAVQVLAVAALVPGIKRFTSTACPWDLLAFGSRVPHISHWDFAQTSAFVGHCFPAGHAVVGFAFFPVALTLLKLNKRAGLFALASVLGIGLALGFAQQMRGAHFLSHTLWTAWICAFAACVLGAASAKFLGEAPTAKSA